MMAVDRFFGRIRTFHFIGMGGIGMSGLAEMLLGMGFRVQGSDERWNSNIERLQSRGASVFIGHAPEHIHGVDTVVFSSAIHPSNPELLAAYQAKIPVIRRAELLAEMMRLKDGIAVAGAHGKTTTTTMIALILKRAGLDPTVVVGGNANNIGTNAQIGTGRFFVAEADESDESFLLLSPILAVVTNIEEEHLDHYRDLNHICDTFSRFLARVPFFGAAVVCGEDPNIASLLRTYQRRTIRYGFSHESDLWADSIRHFEGGQTFQVHEHTCDLGEFTIHYPGRHMILNALASIGIARELGIEVEAMQQALHEFAGVKRRMEFRGLVHGAVLIDDYAHHPTEIAATIEAARQNWNRPLRVVFQPHRFSRTAFLWNDFVKVLATIEHLILLPIYPASEPPREGITSEKLAEDIARVSGRLPECYPSIENAAENLYKAIQPDEVIMTMGAGNVFRIGDLILKMDC